MPRNEPSPTPQATDEVLDRFKRDQRGGVQSASDAGSAQPRGHLKIFFGMAPGVGKTYAMLAAAQRMAAQGVDVAAGVVETHGRSETEQMLLGLDILPRATVEYKGRRLQEFDADAAIRRRPDLVLVDELAHSNVPGSPSGRAKRWQEVEACLDAGVNVYTTLNVQHLESLNDVVAQITGAKVNETVPDRVFDEADEIELVDLPPDALHERLKAGKVYLGEHALRAVDPSDGFFRKGNLLALRELALRRTAAWVDSDLRRYKQERGIRAVWAAGERIVVAVSPSPMSGRLIRAAKRMAAGLHAELIAVYVETPRTASLSADDRGRLDANLRLAESLGATTQTLAGENAAQELLAFARSRNVGKIVVGKTERARWREALLGSFIHNLIRESGDIDIYVVRGDEATPRPSRTANAPAGLRQPEWRRYVVVLLVLACVTAFGLAAFSGLELANVVMIYLAVVVIAALWLGRGPAVLAAVLAVGAFDFFFVPPRWTFAVSDAQYLLTFAVMLGVGALVATLAGRAREQTLRAWSRERATAAQHALARELAAARDVRQVAAVVARHTHDLLRVDVVVCGPESTKRSDDLAASRTLVVLGAAGAGGPDWFAGDAEEQRRERGVAQWAFDHASAAGPGTSTLPSARGRYVPLSGSRGKAGVLGLRIGEAETLDAEQFATLDGLASQAASALERATLSESEQAARINAERERLRSALLSSVSHDLRTPLASITGAATTLLQSDSQASGADGEARDRVGINAPLRAELLRTIVDESARLNDIIASLVFATRLESGSVDLRREWTTVEEIVGAGLARHRDSLSTRPFRVQVPSDLPMLRVDNAMLPQVVHNLVENALRYTPPGTALGVSAWTIDSSVVVKVWDEGAGLAEDEASKVFERFYRGRASRPGGTHLNAPASSGMGLGLTICEGIIRAHAGRIWAEPNTPRGVAFLFSLPIDLPQPSLPAGESPIDEPPAAPSHATAVTGTTGEDGR